MLMFEVFLNSFLEEEMKRYQPPQRRHSVQPINTQPVLHLAPQRRMSQFRRWSVCFNLKPILKIRFAQTFFL